MTDSCPICGVSYDKPISRGKYILHINRDTSNNSEENLITLCSICWTKSSIIKHRFTELDKYDTREKFFKNSDVICDILQNFDFERELDKNK